MTSHNIIVAFLAACLICGVALAVKALLVARRKRAWVAMVVRTTGDAFVHAKPSGAITFRFTAVGHDDVVKAFRECADAAKQFEEAVRKAQNVQRHNHDFAGVIGVDHQ